MQKKNENNVVFPFWQGITFPFETIYKKIRDFSSLIGLFSLAAAILVMIFGQSFACALKLSGWGIYCMDNPVGLLLLFVLLLFMMGLFINCWWLIAFKGMTFAEVIKRDVNGRDVKITGFLLVYLTAFLVIGGGIYLLYARVATPDVMVELAIFVVVSLFILAALAVLLNSVVLARFLDGERWQWIGKTLLPMVDNIYKIVAWFLFYLLLFSHLMKQASNIFRVLQKAFPLWLSSLAGEFALQFVFYFVAALVVSLLKLQADGIFKNEKD